MGSNQKSVNHHVLRISDFFAECFLTDVTIEMTSVCSPIIKVGIFQNFLSILK